MLPQFICTGKTPRAPVRIFAGRWIVSENFTVRVFCILNAASAKLILHSNMMNYCEICRKFSWQKESGVNIAAVLPFTLTELFSLPIMRKTLCLLAATAGLLSAGAVCAAPGEVTLASGPNLPSIHGLAPSVQFGATSLAPGNSFYRRAPETGAVAARAAPNAPTEERGGGSMFLAGAILVVALIVKRISG